MDDSSPLQGRVSTLMDFVDLGRARILGIAILAIAIAAIALLFAGQGPVVATAAVVGVFLGALAGLFGFL